MPALSFRLPLQEYLHFVWPELLWLLVAVPALVVVYLWVINRQTKHAMRWPGIAHARDAQGGAILWRRHVPALLFLTSLILMTFAMARPLARVTLPSTDKTLILAMDVSVSMGATDVLPDRISAAQEAAKRFVQSLPANIRVGIVSFAGTAALAQAPTRNRESVYAAIDRFQLQGGTAIGSGIVVALSTLFPDDASEFAKLLATRVPATTPALPWPVDAISAPGTYPSAAIVLLTDGQRTTGPDALLAARAAADRGVRVYTVGIGTKEGKTLRFEGWSVRVRLDEDSLKAIAALTRGEYFNASSADDLADIYQTLQTRIVLRNQEMEITALLVAASALIQLIAAALSLVWFNRAF